MATASKLDADELLHLALRSSQENQHEKAIDYLKRALDQEPGNAKVHYMLGAEHAEIGLYDRAAEEMAKAVDLDPNLVAAQFQLGLLHLTSARIDEADQAWAPLNRLGKGNPFYLFKEGMLHLVRDEFEECIAALEKGIAVNDINEPLNNDMRRVLNDARNALAGKGAQDKAGDAGGKKTASNILLSAYRNDKEDAE